MADDWKNKYAPLIEKWKDGTLVDASKEELRRYLVLVCLDGFKNKVIPNTDSREIAATVRLLLQIRASEEIQQAANTTNKTVMWLTVLILIITAVQLGVALLR